MILSCTITDASDVAADAAEWEESWWPDRRWDQEEEGEEGEEGEDDSGFVSAEEDEDFGGERP